MYRKLLFNVIVTSSSPVYAGAHDNPDRVKKIAGFPPSFLTKVNKRLDSLEKRLTDRAEKYLQRLPDIVWLRMATKCFNRDK